MATFFQKNSAAAAPMNSFDYNATLIALKERFARQIWLLGEKNTKGCPRYQYEVEFCYALNELEQGPVYLRGKLFERPNNVINRLITFIKTQQVAQQ